jgi:hypothetical protein
MRRVYKNLCPATISASIMAANMWKNRLKNVEYYNNKILYEPLLDFLQLNGAYFLNKPRINHNLSMIQTLTDFLALRGTLRKSEFPLIELY